MNMIPHMMHEGWERRAKERMTQAHLKWFDPQDLASEPAPLTSVKPGKRERRILRPVY